MKKYIGWGHKPHVHVGCDVFVLEGGTCRELRHHVRHSVDGFEWGNASAGAADVALSVLWDVLGYEPEPALYNRFVACIVSDWPMHEGPCWAMTDAGVRGWIAATEAHMKGVLRHGIGRQGFVRDHGKERQSNG